MEVENMNQTLVQAIVLTAIEIEDVEGDGQRAHLVREWLDYVDLGALVRAGLGIEELTEQEETDKIHL